MLDQRVRWTLIALAVMIRIAAVLVLQSYTLSRSTYEHGEIAANLLAGRGFSIHFLGADGPTSQQAPLYPIYVAGTFAIGGIETPQSLLLLQIGQAFLGGLLVAGVLALASEVAPGRTRVAVIAGLIAALHPTLVYAATHVQVALPATTLLVWTLVMAYRSGQMQSIPNAIGAGVLFALLILTDPILVLVLPAAIWAMAMMPREMGSRGPGHSRLLRRILGFTFAAVLGVTPWIVRNWHVHGEPVFIKSTFGYAFWQGNCALSEGTDKVVRAGIDEALAPRGQSLKEWNEALWRARHVAGYIDDIALTKSDYAQLAAVSEPERSRILFRRALSDLRNDPGRYPRLCLRRLRYFVLFDETNPKTRNLVYRVSQAGLTVLALMGWIGMGSELRRRLGPTMLVTLLVVAFHTLTITSARFHIPIEPLLGLWAAGGLASRAAWPHRSAAATGHVVGIGIADQTLDIAARACGDLDLPRVGRG